MFIHYVHTRDKPVRDAAELVASRRPGHHGARQLAADPGMNKRGIHHVIRSAVGAAGRIRALIEASRQRLNGQCGLTLLFWRIGQRIHTEVLAGQPGGATAKSCRPWPSSLSAITGAASRTEPAPNGAVRRPYPDEPILVTLSRQLKLVAFLGPVAAKRPAPAGLLRTDGRCRTLECADAARRIDSMLRAHGTFEEAGRNDRAGVGDPARCAAHDTGAGHARPGTSSTSWGWDTWQEGDLRRRSSAKWNPSAGTGRGLLFVARQKRIQIDDEDFHLDLLFYNRKLRRLVAVELIGEFKAAYKGQMGFTCRWLDKHRQGAGGSLAAGDHPCGQEVRQINAGVGQVRHPRLPVSDHLAAACGAGRTVAAGDRAGTICRSSSAMVQERPDMAFRSPLG